MNSDINDTVQSLASLLKSRRFLLGTAESCTGGGVAHACTELTGSSDWFIGGFVSYSNAAKTRMLGVSAELIQNHGAVSEPVVRAMAEGVLTHSEASLSVSITGVAGPGGGSVEKPVGTVWFGWALHGRATISEKMRFSGDRASVREQAIEHALHGLIAVLTK